MVLRDSGKRHENTRMPKLEHSNLFSLHVRCVQCHHKFVKICGLVVYLGPITSSALLLRLQTQHIQSLLDVSAFLRKLLLKYCVLQTVARNVAFKSIDWTLQSSRNSLGMIKSTEAWVREKVPPDIVWRHVTPISSKWLNPKYWLGSRCLRAAGSGPVGGRVAQPAAVTGHLSEKQGKRWVARHLCPSERTRLFSERKTSLLVCKVWILSSDLFISPRGQCSILPK